VSEIAVIKARFILKHGVDELIATIDASVPWLSLGFAHRLVHSSDEDQHEWLKDKKHIIKPNKRTAKPPRPSIPWTDSQLKALSDEQALVIVEKLASKANRALKPQGERCTRVNLIKEEP
jgi:hypothetical protein